MENILAAILALGTSLLPYITPSIQPKSNSVTLSNLTTFQAEFVKDPNFKFFLNTLGDIDSNYRKTEKLDRKNVLVGALKGILKYSVKDLYSQFVSVEEESLYDSENIDGERKTANGKIVEDVAVESHFVRNNIFYVMIKEFKNVTIKQFDMAVRKMSSRRPNGIVLDLRGNPGGGTLSLCDVLCYLVEPNSLVATLDFFTDAPKLELFPRRFLNYRLRKSVCPVESFSFLRNIPIVILADNDSASASEIMIGALRHYRHAKLVGVKSFGKGIFQDCIMSSLGKAKMTQGRWLTPSGICTQGVGFFPDFPVKDTRKNDRKKSYDAQLEKAIQVLRAEMKKVNRK